VRKSRALVAQTGSILWRVGNSQVGAIDAHQPQPKGERSRESVGGKGTTAMLEEVAQDAHPD
jgi:hypothetical protein